MTLEQNINENSKKIEIDDQSYFEKTLDDQSYFEKTLEKLFRLYSQDEEVIEFFQNEMIPDEQRSLLLQINHRPNDPKGKITRFASKTKNGLMEKMDLHEINNVTITCVMSADTFIDIIFDINKWNQPGGFNMNYAYGTGEVKFVGNATFVHRVLLVKMFDKFKKLIKVAKQE